MPQVYELLLAHDLVVSRRNHHQHRSRAGRAARGDAGATCRRVLSHPIALAQCADFFRQNRGIEAVSVFDTAGAVRMIVQAGDKSTAAIASRRAAALYGAEILAEHIQDHPRQLDAVPAAVEPAHARAVERPQKGAGRLRPAPRARGAGPRTATYCRLTA